jgi:glycerophosphoryl diester phosphodiesterase
MLRSLTLAAALAVASLSAVADAQAAGPQAHVGARPMFLVDTMKDGPLKQRLQSCENGPFQVSDFSIGHRGAPLQYPEHSEQSYRAAARMGAGIIECDVAFTKDRELVCRHAQNDLATTTDILARPELAAKCTVPFTPADPATGKKATAECRTSDLTLAEFLSLNAKMDASDPTATTPAAFMGGTAGWRTDLNTPAKVMSHKQSIALIDSLGRKFTPELKTPSVEMPFEGDYTQEQYAQQLVDEYKEAGISPDRVFLQSFLLDDVLYWIKNEPEFGKQAVYLDGRYDVEGFDHTDPSTWDHSMQELADMGVQIIAPPLWMLVAAGPDGKIIPSLYAEEAKKAGLKIISWSLERSGPLRSGGGWYYQTVNDITTRDGDMFELLEVLAKQVEVLGVFSDWPATTTYYANCMK